MSCFAAVALLTPTRFTKHTKDQKQQHGSQTQSLNSANCKAILLFLTCHLLLELEIY